MRVFNDSLSIKITKSSKILKLFVLIFFLTISFTLTVIIRYITSYAFLIEFEVDYYFAFTYLSSFDICVVTFVFFLCRLFLGCKNGIDAMIINEESDEFSWKIGNILFILGNICYIIYIYLKYNSQYLIL